MTFQETVVYVANKYPHFDVKTISNIASDIFDAYTDGTIKGKTDALEDELAFLNDANHQFDKVTVNGEVVKNENK